MADVEKKKSGSKRKEKERGESAEVDPATLKKMKKDAAEKSPKAAADGGAPAKPKPDPAEVGAAKTARRNRRVFGYREKARECGYARGRGPLAAAGFDAPASMLSAADARRLIKFLPENLEAHAFDAAEFKGRIRAANESVPPTAAREAQARLESVFRHAVNEATLRTVEAGRMRVTAATMHGVLRPYVANMRFTAVLPPKGLVAEAQLAQVLGNPEGMDADADVTADAAFQKEVAELQGLAAENDRLKTEATAAVAKTRAAAAPAKEKKGKKPKKAAA